MSKVKEKSIKAVLLIPVYFTVLFSSCVLSQQWSENYALLDGARSNDPLIIDGRIQTVGQSQIIRKSGSLEVDLHLPSESMVLLPEVKSVHRVVIHSSNLKEFELMARDSNDGWYIIHEHKGKHQPVFDLRINPPHITDSIRLVVRSTTDDGEQKRKNLKVERENEVTRSGQLRRGRPVYKVYGALKAPAKIAEIKLYGFVEKTP